MHQPAYTIEGYGRHPVDPSVGAVLLQYIVDALHACGCAVFYTSDPSLIPFRLTSATQDRERFGIVAYAFLVERVRSRNRATTYAFEAALDASESGTLEIWQDPTGLMTTLFLGIDPKSGIFVAADPVLHDPIELPLSIFYSHVCHDLTRRRGSHAWEREQSPDDGPIEILVGGKRHRFLRYVRFEGDALGEDQGHRHMLAERYGLGTPMPT